MVTLERYDSIAARVAFAANAIPFDPNSPAKLVPGFRYDAKWQGPMRDRPEKKVWHFPLQSLPVLLRTFPGITSADAFIIAAIDRAARLNVARTMTMEYARELAARIGGISDAACKGANGKTLREYQRGAVLRTLAAGGTRGLFHQTGTGKTITTAALLGALTQKRDGMRVSVVVCPVTLIDTAWMQDLSDWFPEIPTVNLRDYPKGLPREIAVADCVRTHGRCVALINYETMRTDKSVRRIMSGAFVVFDEVSKCKNAKSSISVACRDIAPTFRGCVLLSGTPAPNTKLEYWPLAKILAPAAGYDPFPGGYSAFTKEFCEVKTFRRRGEPGKEHFAGFEFKDDLAARIHARLSICCEWLKKEDCLDLPPKVFQRVPIALSHKTASVYEEMRDAMRVAVMTKYGQDLRAHATNALSQMMKLRQITSGYVPAFPQEWIEGKQEDAKVLVPLGREKIDWLLEHCETVNERIVIWTQFVFEAARYVKELRERQAKSPKGDEWLYSCDVITGEVATENRKAIFQRFVAGEYQVLIAHPGVAQWGVSFPGVSLAGYGSLSYSLQEFAQSQDRIHGIGRGDVNKKSTFYLLAATANGARTVDDDCIDVLEGKREALDLVFDIDRERRERGFVSEDVGQRIDA
jgi:superfamily II DNA or RNA helicase